MFQVPFQKKTYPDCFLKEEFSISRDEKLLHRSPFVFHFPETKIILHSHGLFPVLLSSVKKNYFEFQGNEIQKGFDGEVSHLSKLRIPLFDNSQDMSFFEKELCSRKSEILHSCFAISKHGTYAWGKNLFEAKRHLETLDYLCQLEWNLIQK